MWWFFLTLYIMANLIAIVVAWFIVGITSIAPGNFVIRVVKQFIPIGWYVFDVVVIDVCIGAILWISK